MPKISVIVPAYNAAALLPACLAALGAQSRPPDEVIVVDDGSTDGTAEAAKPYRARLLKISHGGPAAARNRGAVAATGEILLFTDADCAPAPDWVAQMEGVFADREVAGARGVYLTRQRGLVPRFVQQEYQDKYDRLRPLAPIDFIDTYSAAYRRNIFLDNGGFETAFPAPSVEDQEFSFRLFQKGYRLVFAPRAAVYHQHDASAWEYVRRKFNIGYWKAFLLRWHPEKTLADSHTPLSQRLQIGLLGALGLCLAAGLGFHRLLWGAAALGALFFLSALPFLLKLLGRDWPAAVVAPAMLVCRAGALGAGLALGLAKGAGTVAPRRPALSGPQRFIKRALDISGAALALAVSLPVLMLLAIWIKMDSPGPVLYRQKRAGENGRTFSVLKLRSMVAGADQLRRPAAGKCAGDLRVTRAGRFMRRWSLDELPQFWNVLKGDMSLVGPRPEEAAVVAHYSDWHRGRLAVKPGLTGPMQINGRAELSLDERVRLELEYIAHYSLRRDMAILAQTIPAVLRGRGAY